MPRFHFQAADKTGQEIVDFIEAGSETEAMQTLAKRNLTVLEIRQTRDSQSGQQQEASASQIKPVKGKVPTPIIMHFYEQLSFLLKAGIPIFLAIRMLSEQIQHPVFQDIMKNVLFELSEGLPLSECLKKYGETFPGLHVNLIGVGEKSGNLDAALTQLVDLVKEQQEIREKISKAAAYPLFLLGLCISLVVGMLVFVFPKFEEIFKAFNVKLPGVTAFFIDASHALRDKAIMIVGVAGVVIYGVVYFFMHPSMSETRDKFLMKVPLIKDVLVAMFVALFSKTLGSLLKSGIPLMEGLTICQQTIKGELKRKFFEKVITAVKEGEMTSKAMEGHMLMPDMALQLFIVGERTGHIDHMLENIFHYYKKQYNALLTKTTAVLQPILLFFAAVLICLVAISLFVPLFKLSSSMKQGD